MQRLGELWRTFLAMVGRRRLDRDLAEEMRFHLEMKAQEHLDAGMKSEEAHFAAQRQFGNQTLLQEVSREAVPQDVRGHGFVTPMARAAERTARWTTVSWT